MVDVGIADGSHPAKVARSPGRAKPGGTAAGRVALLLLAAWKAPPWLVVALTALAGAAVEAAA